MFKDYHDEKEMIPHKKHECAIVLRVFIANVRFFNPSTLESLEIVSGAILSGKAKVILAGGLDDITEEGWHKFADTKATSNGETEFAIGHESTETSHLTTNSHAGFMFMESQGTGVYVVMSPKADLGLGIPIPGFLTFTYHG